MSLPITD